MSDKGPTRDCEPQLHWFLQWCFQTIGTNLENVQDRLDDPWALLVILGPCLWLRAATLISVFGYGTGWHWCYYFTMTVQALCCFVFPYSLRYRLADWEAIPLVKVWSTTMMAACYLEMLLPIPGFINSAMLAFVPFRSPTWTLVYLYGMVPLILVLGHVCNPSAVSHDVGKSTLSMVVGHTCNALRALDPLADGILGVRMILSATRGNCAFKGVSDCNVHTVLGSVITAASSLDLVFGIIVAQGFNIKLLPNLDKYMRQAVLEGGMLLCEGTIFACSILAVKWDMADGSEDGFQDMAVYTVLCSISTFFALAVTLLLLSLPKQVWATLDENGLGAALKAIVVQTIPTRVSPVPGLHTSLRSVTETVPEQETAQDGSNRHA